MVIGVDFDNTIVCYDAVFPKAAVDRGLIPAGKAATKGAVRDYLRSIGQEDRWTELQGYVYGPGMKDATPFPGVTGFFSCCRAEKIPIFIVSHRTLHPYLGEKYDLHKSARDWLATYGFNEPQHIFLELSKRAKMARIAALGCTHFVEDLPEFLSDPEFPAGVQKILFDPGNIVATGQFSRRVSSWQEIDALLRKS